MDGRKQEGIGAGQTLKLLERRLGLRRIRRVVGLCVRRLLSIGRGFLATMLQLLWY
jgi:hypothetical protein